MRGLKSAILAIFQKSAYWLDWTCPVSAALQNGSQDFFSFLYFNFQMVRLFKKLDDFGLTLFGMTLEVA